MRVLGVKKINKTERVPALDGLRGIAIISVLLYHFLHWGVDPSALSPAGAWVSSLFRGGWAGVNLFFVLSGFLITRLLLESHAREHYYRDFFLKRVLRIVPALWLTLAFMFFLDRKALDYIGLTALFLPNFATGFGVHNTNPSLWSLGVEEQFYFVWPFLVKKIKRQNLKWVLLGVGILLPGARYLYGHEDFFTQTWFRIDGFGWGALLAVLLREPKFSGIKNKMFPISFGLGTLLLLVTGPFGGLTRKSLSGIAFQVTIFDLFSLSLLCLVLFSPLKGVESFFQNRFLRYAGKRSYGLYLVHVPIFFAVSGWMQGFFGLSGDALTLFSFLAASLGSFGFAELSGRYIEEPILKFKRLLEIQPPHRTKAKEKKAA